MVAMRQLFMMQAYNLLMGPLMANKIQIRRDTAANWTSANPTLSQGEQGYETDTGKLKIGDGSTAWTSQVFFWRW